MRTPDQHFFTVHDAATDAKVGWLWFQVRDDGVHRSAYLCDIVIFDEHRRQGYGTACLAELDDQAKGLGIRRVGLHVFGHNTGAMELLSKLKSLMRRFRGAAVAVRLSSARKNLSAGSSYSRRDCDHQGKYRRTRKSPESGKRLVCRFPTLRSCWASLARPFMHGSEVT